MACDQDKIEIATGHNVWVLARTDRDAADREEVLQSAGAALTRFLGQASPLATRSLFEVLQSPKNADNSARFIIGAARPVNITAQQHVNIPQLVSQGVLTGRELGNHGECDTIRTVSGQAPWYVIADFDWRAPSTKTPWPRRKVNALGFPEDADVDLDWLLLAAFHQGKSHESDTTLLDEVSDETRQQIEDAVKKGKRALNKALTPWAWGIGLSLAAVTIGGIFYYTKKPARLTR